MNTFKWNSKSLLAAQLIAEGDLSYRDVATQVGVKRDTLARWRTLDLFTARVEEIRETYRAHVRRRGIAIRERRVAQYNDRWERMRQLILARAVDPEMQDIPGGNTGLLVKTVKGIGSGDNFRQVEEFVFDDRLMKEIRELERQAGEDLGQWTEKREVTQSGSVSLTLEIEGAISKVYGQTLGQVERADIDITGPLSLEDLVDID